MALTIEHDGSLVVTSPDTASIDALNAVVRARAPWVLQRVRDVRERLTTPSEREFVTGESVLYLGRQLRLKVREETELAAPRMWAGWYEVPVVAGLRAEERRREVRQRLAASLREHADAYLSSLLVELCRRARLKVPAMLVREQRKRWGSCDADGTLRINWRIIQAPRRLIEYVLAHELVHRVHPSHGTEFWAALGRMMPDYEERRRRLRALGPSLEW